MLVRGVGMVRMAVEEEGRVVGRVVEEGRASRGRWVWRLGGDDDPVRVELRVEVLFELYETPKKGTMYE